MIMYKTLEIIAQKKNNIFYYNLKRVLSYKYKFLMISYIKMITKVCRSQCNGSKHTYNSLI